MTASGELIAFPVEDKLRRDLGALLETVSRAVHQLIFDADRPQASSARRGWETRIAARWRRRFLHAYLDAVLELEPARLRDLDHAFDTLQILVDQISQQLDLQADPAAEGVRTLLVLLTRAREAEVLELPVARR